MALLDRIATIFFDSKAARAKAIIHSIAVEKRNCEMIMIVVYERNNNYNI